MNFLVDTIQKKYPDCADFMEEIGHTPKAVRGQYMLYTICLHSKDGVLPTTEDILDFYLFTAATWYSVKGAIFLNVILLEHFI